MQKIQLKKSQLQLRERLPTWKPTLQLLKKILKKLATTLSPLCKLMFKESTQLDCLFRKNHYELTEIKNMLIKAELFLSANHLDGADSTEATSKTGPDILEFPYICYVFKVILG